MGRKSPKPPPEDRSVVASRERSILDLAKLDEEQNRRIKQLKSASRGVRAFRAMRSSSGSGSVLGGSSGGTGSTGGGSDGGGGNPAPPGWDNISPFPYY